jgi:hypothetical protein
MKPGGWNPITWPCEEQGCWNIKCRPKIEYFAGCWPGKISMSDIDGIVEINGHYLVLEWKRHDAGEELPVGQRIMFERLSATGLFTVAVVKGNPETMDVRSIRFFWNGKQHQPEASCLADVQQKFERWAAWAKGVRAA